MREWEPPPPPAVFVGRRQEADRLARLIRVHPVVTVSGPPGIGKTALVSWVARRIAKSRAKAVVWLDARRLSGHDANEQFVGALASAERRSALLVVDGAQSLPPRARRELLDGGRMLSSGRLIAILRQRPVLDPLGALEMPDVTVGSLPQEVARSLLRRTVRDAGLTRPSPLEEEQLLRQFGATPLGLRLACGLGALGVSWAELARERSRRLGGWLAKQLGELADDEVRALAVLALSRARLTPSMVRSASKCEGETTDRLLFAGLIEQDGSGRLMVPDSIVPLCRHLLPEEAAPVHAAIAAALAASRGASPDLDLARAELEHARESRDPATLDATYRAVFGRLFRAGEFTSLRGAQEVLAGRRRDHRFRLDSIQILILCGRLDDAARLAAELLGEHLPLRVRAEAHLMAGSAARSQGKPAEASPHYRDALVLYRRSKDTDGEARATNNLANTQVELGLMSEAEAQYQRVLQLSRAIDNRFGVAAALANLGMLALRRKDATTAGPFLEEALAVRAAQQDWPGMASVMTALANRADLMDDPERALALCEDALELRLSTVAPAGILECRMLHAHLLDRAGRRRESVAELVAALWIAVALRHAARAAEALERLARADEIDLSSEELALALRAGELTAITGLWAALAIGSAAKPDALLARAARELDGALGCLAARALADRTGRPHAGPRWTERVSALPMSDRIRFLELARAVGLEGPPTYLIISRTDSRVGSAEEAWCLDGTSHGLFVDGRDRRVWSDGRLVVDLGRHERAWRLLWALVRRRGAPAPLAEVYTEVTGETFVAGVHENNCYVMLRRLRVHLKDASGSVEVDGGRMYFDARRDFVAVGRPCNAA